ncbi:MULTISPECIES: slr1658 superfamily regulator [Leptospira]|uniref:Histidine kinase n=3 Tax=Leptospira TaxID=171 RepID=A0A6N4Q9H0_9LEPT|nr:MULTISPECIES: histidine kinase [Leptospira]MCW7468712.1 histidine kinase [Leptospira kanakyensis]MCW7479705.1 histidine kinase [Leptospira kanakyensis]TGK49943.1 histidine kinase [Leptospira kanakyensis]TGK58540.1 histidine kinase [Leptospira kanakyensis]TGK69081.1 histidine kinase [Leptospira kanakyensis]
MNQKSPIIIGEYHIIPENLPADGQLRLIFQPIDMTTYWRRCGLTANFVAGFYSYCYEASETKANSLSTIINELLENASKFSKAREGRINVELKQYGNLLRIDVLNVASKTLRDSFEIFVNKLLSENVEEMYFSTLETKEDGDTKSGLGLLMMLKDYPVRFGYSFHEVDADTHEITVRAIINVEEI